MPKKIWRLISGDLACRTVTLNFISNSPLVFYLAPTKLSDLNTNLLDTTKRISTEDVVEFTQHGRKLEIPDNAINALNSGRTYLDKKSAISPDPIYGVNTGFGSLCNTIIGEGDLETLQKNLLLSHACGTGEEVPADIVRLMLLLKIRGLVYGNSGVSVETAAGLISMYNCGILPVIYQQGSLGASGDLAPLAHLALPLIGSGTVDYEGARMSGKAALEKAGIPIVRLRSKEGLALINGTQFMSSYALWCVQESLRLLSRSTEIAAMSLDAFDGRIEPFDEVIHRIRPHVGQLHIAAQMRGILSGSEIITRDKKHVQDPYSFRCFPQVAGASYDAMMYVKNVVETEINSVTDNPIVSSSEDKIISGGNFHGQPLSLALDFLAIAAAELGSISERRTYKLISGQRDLPPYLTPEPGLNSGLMIPQYTAASIVSQNKQLCTPASIDTIDSSNGQEDHVSMGANAATKCYRIVENLKTILAIELLNAAQALEFRRPLRSSVKVEALHDEVRKVVPFNTKDIYLSDQINSIRKII